MAMESIAYTAAAGAMALALSTTYLAWRLRKRTTVAREALRADLAMRDVTLSELDAATSAFDEAFLAVEGDAVRLVWGDDTLKQCAEALGLKNAKDSELAPRVVEALGETSPEAALGLKNLISEGRSCRFEVFAEGAGTFVSAPAGVTLVVEGKSSGATAWIRLAIAGAKASLSSGPFAQMAEHLPAPSWICARDGRIVWANAAFLKATETATLEEALKTNATLDRSADALVEEAVSGHARREGFRWITVNGQRRSFHIIAEPLNDAYTSAYAIDVTEAEESREALKRHAKAHDETLDALEDAVAIFGPEKQLTFHNRAFEKLWELEPAWLAERPTHGEWLDRLRQKRRLPETSDYSAFKTRELEFYGLTQTAADEMWTLPDGRSMRVVRQPHPLGGLLLLFSDKTGELKLKAQFNSLIQVQKSTLDQLNDAVIVFGSDGRLRLRNQSFDKFWELGSDDINPVMDFGQVAELCLPLVHDRSFWSELKARVTDTDPLARAPQLGEIRISDGRLAQWRTQPLPDGATLVAFSDITATRQLEKAIDARDEALNESVRLKRDFVANVSYELRTPLTTIVGYADLLHAQNKGQDTKQKAFLESIQSAAQELARSIDDVLDMAQIDAGEMSVAPADVRLFDIVVESGTRQAEMFKARGVRFDYEGVLEADTVHVDARRLGQCLDHLLGNAIRNAASGSTVNLKANKQGDILELEVSYAGRGIPYHVQAHIFDRYVGRERGGPGLGLALVKALVELHDGWITLESEPTEGASFKIHLPNQSRAGQGVPAPAHTPEPLSIVDTLEDGGDVEDVA
ncbi:MULTISPECIES: ATP-binding protein [Asticcacaulis]|uniref:PAS domain-containing sensor histidine kinase n=1 Tax=Asticcacaulis TaxID=76890 RepID=UPI001AEA16D0|nr:MULTISPECIES: ATP-binding protein [Asticcacaulis]MBP2160093.1 signal transduction histidine kinase [Asticcacaulis solisilvae]MDR6801138.1 signal transduction histidine kinase [Asticcacaulis sp. BE141]